jgi:hypothetical protein
VVPLPSAGRDASREPDCRPAERSQSARRVTITLKQADRKLVDPRRRHLSRPKWLLHAALRRNSSGLPDINCDAWSQRKESMDFARQIAADPAGGQCCEKTSELGSQLLRQLRELRNMLVGVQK